MSPKNYIPQLTFLRFLAAILIVTFHFGSNLPLFRSRIVEPLISEASIGVSFFFFLSGVVLGISYFQKAKIDLRQYLKKRFARIYPLYLLSFLLALLFIVIYLSAKPKGISIILQTLGMHAWSPGMCLEINFPSWSVSVEIFFYLLLPVLFFIRKKIGFGMWTILTFLLYFGSAYLHYTHKQSLPFEDINKAEQFILYFPIWHLNTFVFGLWSAELIRIVKLRFDSIKILGTASFFVGCMLFLAIFYIQNPIKPYVHNGLLSPIFMLIIVGLAVDTSWVSKVLSNRYALILGNSSYAIYLLQWPVYLIFTNMLNIHNLNQAQFCWYLAALTIISIVVYRNFETPIRKWLIRAN